MPAITTLSLTDAEATPVVHNFIPRGIEGSVASYADVVSGIEVGSPTCTVSFVRAGKNSKVNRARFTMVYPVLETLGTASASGILPAPTKAYDLRGSCEFLLPVRSTLQDRKNVRQLMIALINHAVGLSVVGSQENVY